METRNTDVCVKSTTNYEGIKHINGNRLVNPSNVEKLKASMVRKHLVVPAILNENMEVIDGQHRLQACIELGLPFYYIIVDGYSLKEVQMMNANMKNWSSQDFLDSFLDLYKLGNSQYRNYVVLKDFMEKTELPLRTALFLSNIKKSPSDIDRDFKNGNFEFEDINIALDIAEALRDFKKYDGNRWCQVGFAKVFSQFYLNSNYVHEVMINNLPFTYDRLSLMANEKSVRANLIEMYNRRLPRTKKLYLQSLEDEWEDMIKA